MNKETKEKICTFFASDYHFEMISLPYIDKKLEENEEIIILTENNLEDTIQTLLSKMNFKEDRKKKILSINWKNDDFTKFKEIKREVENQNKVTIFIKGKENYIRNINKNIENWINKNSHIKVVDCYDVEEIGNNIDTVMASYKSILSTSGEKEIEKL